MIVSNPVTYDPRVTIEAETLSERGYAVTVLGWDREATFPSEEEDGFRVVRLRNTAYMRLLPRDLLRLRPWWRLAAREARRLHRDTPFAVVHCHDLDTLPSGVGLRRALGVPLIYDAHEIWGYMLARDVPDAIANHFLRKERRLLKSVDAVLTVSAPMRRYYEAVTPAPVTLVLNAKRLPSTSYVPPDNPTFTAVCIGRLNTARFVLELMEVAEELQGVHLVLAGFGEPGYIQAVKARSRQATHVEFRGVIPRADVIPTTQAADAVVCLTNPADRNNAIGVSNKLFEAMAAGRPILASRDTYQAKFINREGVGLAVEHSKEGVREGLTRLRDDANLRETLGRQALKRAVEEFSWERQQERLLTVYESTVP